MASLGVLLREESLASVTSALLLLLLLLLFKSLELSLRNFLAISARICLSSTGVAAADAMRALRSGRGGGGVCGIVSKPDTGGTG